MIYKKNSDITHVTSGVIAHGVNRKGVMGSGVTKALYHKWPIVRHEYLNNKPIPSLGSVEFIKVTDNVTVANCYTQEKYGYDRTVQYASLKGITDALEEIAKKHKTINIPKIGAGLGGLNWEDVEKELCEIEEKYKVEFIVHTL